MFYGFMRLTSGFIFEILGYPGVLGESISLEMYSPDGGRSREMVRDSMGIKSPRTAIKRAQTARSLKALEVAALEKLMLTDMNPIDKYMLGAVLFCLFSRSRWSDVKHIQQLWIEESSHEGEIFGFIEGRTQHHKSATSLAKKRRFMPLVCPLLGITGSNWVEAWMQSWKDLDIDIDKQPFGPLCRVASSSGGLCNRACTSDEITIFINAVLKATDPASSHSLKHTTLEWCSSYGLDEDARKLLGHHSLSGGKALAVYSRDLLNRPLQLYCSMLRNIRLDHFRPDESRTSRLIDALRIQAGGVASETQNVNLPPAESVEVPTTTEEAQISEAGEDTEHDESSSSSSSSSSDDMGDDGKHDGELHDWISGPVWRNIRSKVVHKDSVSSTSTLCGRLVDVSRFEYLTMGCSTCLLVAVFASKEKSSLQ